MKHRSRLATASLYVILGLAALFAVYPVYFAFLASLRPGNSLYSTDLASMFLPTQITLENYRVMSSTNRSSPGWVTACSSRCLRWWPV